MTIPWALSVPVVIFLGVIVPLWITYHYITVWLRMRSGTTAAAGTGKVVIDRAEIERLQRIAETLEKRIDSLETILDADAPDWRKQ